MDYSKLDLQEHLEKEHQRTPFADYLKEIVYGGNDGIITTFAVVAGFAGAQSGMNNMGYLTVLLFGLANLFADASSMGLGNILSMRAEQDRYKREREKEQHEIQNNAPMEKAESIEILQQKGFQKEDAAQIVEIYAKNEEYWTDFMMNYELEMPDPRGENPWLNGLATFFSFIVFGAIPLLPYVLLKDESNTFIYAVGATLLALFILGVLRWKVTKIAFYRSVGEIMLLGGLSAVIAYFVGTFFRV